jgi:hypothetical protein
MGKSEKRLSIDGQHRGWLDFWVNSFIIITSSSLSTVLNDGLIRLFNPKIVFGFPCLPPHEADFSLWHRNDLHLWFPIDKSLACSAAKVIEIIDREATVLESPITWGRLVSY